MRIAPGQTLPVLKPFRLAAHAGFRRATPPRRARRCVLLAPALCVAVGIGEAVAAPAAPSILATLLKWTPLLAKGFALDIAMSFFSMGIGTVAGVVVGLGLISLHAPLRGVAWAVTQLFRNAPWLVLLFYCMLLLPFELHVGGFTIPLLKLHIPVLFTIPLPDWLKATLGLALPVMANVAELVRGAVRSIPFGQWEASEALAFTRRQTLWMVILPQCVKRMTPPWMNLYAILVAAMFASPSA